MQTTHCIAEQTSVCAIGVYRTGGALDTDGYAHTLYAAIVSIVQVLRAAYRTTVLD